MKKLLYIFLIIIALLALAACSGGTGNDEQPPADTESTTADSLVLYFSCTGNTETVAQAIAAATGSDIYEIVPEDPYTEEDISYNNDNCRANLEMQDETARPAIEGNIDNLAAYDTIYIGYPIWWGTMPRIINTLFDSYDFSGKTLLPFCTSGGSGIEESVAAIRTAEPQATVVDGLQINGSAADSSTEQINQWLQSNQ